jgi:hypothetical protein
VNALQRVGVVNLHVVDTVVVVAASLRRGGVVTVVPHTARRAIHVRAIVHGALIRGKAVEGAESR